VRVGRLGVELDAVELRASDHPLLANVRQRLPRNGVVDPLLQEQDRPARPGAPLGDERELRRLDQAWVLGAVDEPGQVPIVTVRPARRLVGDGCKPGECGDRVACRVEDHVIGNAGDPEHRIVLRRRHDEVADADQSLVEPRDIDRR
jgi:hypothetical protein